MDQYEMVRSGDTVGRLCERHGLSRAEFFRLNVAMAPDLLTTEDRVLTAQLREGQQVRVFSVLLDKARKAAAQGRGVPTSDISLDMLFSELSGEHPILGAMQGAIDEGQDENQFVSSLSAAGKGALATVCTIVSGILAKLPKSTIASVAIAAFVSACCAILGDYLSQPDAPDTTCTGDQIFVQEYGRCGPKNTLSPCADGMGFVSVEGVCIQCPPGYHYNASTHGCEEGCPPGRSYVPQVGCVLPGFGKRCAMPDGSKGVVFQNGECTPDGCDPGYIYDFNSMSCVKEGSQGISTGKDKTTGTEESRGWSTGAMVAAGIAGLAVVGGIGYTLSKSGARNEKSAPAYKTNPIMTAGDLVQQLYDLKDQDPQKGSDLAVSAMDDFFLENRFSTAEEVLLTVDVTRLSPATILALLSISYHAKDKLPSRPKFFIRAKAELVDKLGEERAERLTKNRF